MKNNSDIAPNSKSTFGIISILAPIIGGAGFFGAIHLYLSDPAGFGGVFLAIGLFFGASFLGFLFSLIAIFKKERPKAWHIAGFLLNIPFVLVALPYIFK